MGRKKDRASFSNSNGHSRGNSFEEEFEGDSIKIIRRRNLKFLKARNESQRRFIKSIKENDVLFNIGPAGSGKSYVAVSHAMEALLDKHNHCKNLILVRPAVGAEGEQIGFLPGSKEEKLAPYMRPIYDIMKKYVDMTSIKRWIDEEIIEISPLTFMRGRCFNDSIVILDEGQNTTPGQMKMFLTRIGENSKFIITGDIAQTDIKNGRNGIQDAMDLFEGDPGIDFIFFKKDEIVRSERCKQIVDKYETRD